MLPVSPLTHVLRESGNIRFVANINSRDSVLYVLAARVFHYFEKREENTCDH